MEACIRAGMDIERWVANDYDRKLMAQVVANYRLHHLVETHLEDARNRAVNSKRR